MVVMEYSRWEGGVIGSARCEGSAARHASVNVQVYQVPVILANEESAVGCEEEPIKPGQILSELGEEGEGSLFWTLPESIILLRNKRGGGHTRDT